MGPLARQATHLTPVLLARRTLKPLGPGRAVMARQLTGRARSDDDELLAACNARNDESERVDVGYHRFARANAESTLPLVARCVIASSVSAPRNRI